MRPSWYRFPALTLLAALTASCFSVQSRQRPATELDGDQRRESGGIALRLFADDDARNAGQPGPRGLYVELERRKGEGWEPVFRSLEPAWSVMGLPPGSYRLRFPFRLDEQGNEMPLDERPRKVRVRAGEVTEVDAVLEHVDKGLIAAGIVAAVVAAVLLDDWLGDHDLPKPPLPPPPHELLDAVFWVSLDLATVPHEPWSPVGPSRAPAVTSTFPPEEALVATRHLRVNFTFSEPLQEERFGDDCIALEGEESGPIPGRARYDPERWWAVWESDETLPRGETIRATLFADCAVNRRGLALAGDEILTFRTAP